MSSLSNTDKLKLEKLLDMGGGYVLDFTNATFQQFIRDSVGKDIYSERYATYGDSKAKRLREFWSIESDSVVGTVLLGLLEHWETQRLLNNIQTSANDQKLYDECKRIAERLSGQKVAKPADTPTSEEEFLKKEIGDINLDSLGFDEAYIRILKQRLSEIEKCLHANAPLSAIFLAGSTLEGILLGVASRDPKTFNQSGAAPTDKNGKVKQLHNWSLSQLIDVAHDVKYIGLDVKKFSHALRDFRNYIHPHQQSTQGFEPDKHTAEICWKVFRATVANITKQTHGGKET